MPDPGSHGYDVKRTRLRAEYDDRGVPDQHADDAANAELQREHPPTRVGDTARAAGPQGERPREGRAPAGRQDVIHVRSSAFTDHDLMPSRFAHAFDHPGRVPADLPAADLRATMDDRATATGTLVGLFGR